MATTKITNPDLFDITANTALRLPSGSTEQRPTSPSTGEWRYNTTTNLVEYYDGGKWRELLSEDLPPIPSENFNTVTYTGDGTAGRAVTVGFQPDYVWIKTRNNANSWTNTDSTRGVNAILSSNVNASESTFDSSWRSSYGQIASFTSTGFTVNAGSASGNFNTSGSNYVAYCWKANGGTTSSNTDGSITSTVQANTGAGFSVVSYSGTGSTGTYGHGLSSSPDLIITKRTDAVEGWLVWSSSLSASNYMYLNSTGAAGTDTNAYKTISSTTNQIGTDVTVNTSGGSYISYCFHSVAGYSKMGTYTGNGSTNGPIINIGFEPAFVMIKRTDTADAWYVYDNKKTTSNPRNKILLANTSDAELTSTEYYSIDFLSTGFQLRSALSTATNANGGSYLYIAFASDPSTAPVLADSFNTTLYTGDGQDGRSITGLGFSPSFVWTKERSSTSGHVLFDVVRGPGNQIITNLTDAQTSGTNRLQSFDSDGFTIGTSGAQNANGDTYVSWNWKANALPAINTDGTIQSVVSANQAAGFSIVKYTGTGVTGTTVGHSLSSAPELWIGKQLTGSSINWQVLYSGFSEGDYLTLNTTAAKANSANVTFDPTATTVKFHANQALNANGEEYIGYAFHSVSGFSAIGTYAGNGTSQSVTLGFEPTFLMLRKYDDNQDWFMFDSTRDTSNPKTLYLEANTSDAEATVTSNINFTSTGLEFTSANFNDSGKNFIYIAFKENPTPQPSAGYMSFLVVAGGASGGRQNAGGGGAGGLRTSYGATSGGGASAESDITLAAGTYTITVGAGGAALASSGVGNNGVDSSIAASSLTTITSTGGGGGYGNSGSTSANSGGSGGGAGTTQSNTASSAGSGTANQGFDGGARNAAANTYAGGGGGGASAAGQASTGQETGGNGGAGLAVAITGSAVTYAGGGGGGGITSAGSGGAGGGTAGGLNNGAVTDATANTGGGSGGTRNNVTAGSGGSGVVILRLATSEYSGTTTGSPTVTTDGDYTVLTYTGSGTYVHS